MAKLYTGKTANLTLKWFLAMNRGLIVAHAEVVLLIVACSVGSSVTAPIERRARLAFTVTSTVACAASSVSRHFTSACWLAVVISCLRALFVSSGGTAPVVSGTELSSTLTSTIAGAALTVCRQFACAGRSSLDSQE